MKVCSKCEKIKPLGEYFVDKRTNSPRSYCKSCQNLMNKEWRDKNKDKIRVANRGYALKHRLKNKYNLSEDEYRLVEQESNGRCRICNNKRKLFIDHDHSTGKFRGLICNQCNTILGMAGDSVATLQNCIKYLNG